MMSQPSTARTLRSYLPILRQYKWWVSVFTLLGLALSIAWSLTQTPQFTATAQVLIQTVGSPSQLAAPQPVTQTEVLTELQLVTSAPVASSVRRTLGSTPAVSTAEVGQTNVINISATASSPARAALIANTYARAFSSYRQKIALRNLTEAEAQIRSQLSTIAHQFHAMRGQATMSSNAAALLNQEAVLKEQLAQIEVNGVSSTDAVILVTPAQAPRSPSAPKPAIDAALGLAAGLVIGVGAAFLRQTFDDTVMSKEAAEEAGQVPVLAIVPWIPAWKKRKQTFVVSLANPTSPATECYRSLRTSIQFLRQDRNLKVLLVTSPGIAEGKTSTTSNLGVVFSQAGERVVLVSCDLRRPRIGGFFGIDEHQGLTSVLLGEASLRDVLRRAEGQDNLWLLPAGPVPAHPAELLSGSQFNTVLHSLRQNFDLVLIDSPPILPVTDGVLLSSKADATLLIAAGGQTRHYDLHRAAEKLAQANVSVIGTVLNVATKQGGRSNAYGHEYGYYYGSRLGSPIGAARSRPNGNSPALAHGRHAAGEYEPE